MEVSLSKTAFAVALLLLPLAMAAQETLEAALAAQRAAQSVHAPVLAPRAFARGEAGLAALRDALGRGADAGRIASVADETVASFAQAEAHAALAGATFAPAMEARESARRADAPLWSENDWQAGEKRLADAINALERDDNERAERRRDEALAHFRAAELQAIKTTWLTEARALIVRAEKDKAERHAPRTLARAKALLAEAELALESNRLAIDEAQRLARAARYEAEHALALTGYIRNPGGEKRTLEDAILEWETILSRIATAAGIEVNFAEGPAATEAAVRAYIEAAQAREERQAEELSARNRRIVALQTELSAVERMLSEVDQERMEIAGELETQARTEERISRLEGLFKASEATILRERGGVLIRLIGISFDSGQASLGADQYPLLDKLAQAMFLFPESPIIIEGHTDSSGQDQRNLQLSIERAAAVRQYLLAKTAAPLSLIQSTGYGETRPLADNETRAGRASNRRIDIRIQVEPSPPGASPS